MQLIIYISKKIIDRFIIFIRNFVHYFLIAYLLTGPSFGQEVVSNTLPVLSSIQSGNVNINSNNNVLNINQSSNKAIIDWKTFDVGSESTVNFNQPSASSSTLNKILSSDPSKIFGKLNATGEVIFQNYGGIYFGKNSRLDVGSITATTGNIRNEDYLNNNYKFDLTNSTGNIENLGEINAFENYVALLSPEVRNSGLIVAEKTAVLGSGNEVTLNFINGGTLHSITTTESNVDTLVENKSAVEVPGGLIIISIQAKSSLVSSIINQEGSLNTEQADQVVKKDGRIFLQASTINLSNNSEMIASGNDAGGLINLSAKDININENSVIDVSGEIAGEIELNSTKGDLNLINSTLKASSNDSDGGKISIASTENIIIENSNIEARGLINGGQILIGNDYLEKTIPIAKSTILDINTTLDVSSYDTSGIGGLIETSGLKLITNASIQAGEGGSWIIDPFDITIDETIAGYINTALTAGTSVTLTTATETNDINNDPVNTITGSSGEGDIILNSAITSSGNGSLTLIAADDIFINAAISLSGTNNQVTLTAADIVYLGASITTTGNQTINANVDIQGSSTLNSGLANITINGNVTASNGILAFLGDGDYLYNGTSYTVDGTEPIGILYDAASDTYKWQATVTTAEALIVAGGGGGGMDMGGGGGGGGVIAQDITLTPGWIDVKVGDGGAGAPTGGTGSGTQGINNHVWTINAKQGGDSSIVTANGTLTAIGGGYGGTGPWNHTLQGQAGSGGSGGGASGYNAGTSGRNGSGTAGQGNAGASGSGHHVAGGGGGAGGAGSTGRSHYSAVGGPGIENCILGTCYYWAGGGGGGSYNYYGGHGGIGGGGGGGTGSTTGGAGFNNGSAGGGGGLNQWANKPGGNGGANTGGGGGGGSHYNATNQGGDGGSGIVVVKYSTANSLNLTASNGTVTLDTDLKLSNLDTFKVTENTTRDFNFNSLTLVNSPFDLVNQKLTTKTLSIDSGSSITNSSGFSMVEVTGTSSIGGTITTSGKVFNKADVAVKTKAEALVDDPADAVYAESEWGQYYGDKITLTSNASLISYRDVVDENDEFGAAIHLNGVEGNYKFTVDANNGWIVSNNKIGDAPIVDTDSRVIALNSGRTAYYSNYDYTEKLNNSVKNVKEVDFKANEIYLRADVITDYNQTYTGHVNIGNNGTNGLERNLTSVDPTIAFYGKPVLYETEVNGQTVRLTSKEIYTFDDESLTPTHTLNLTAKGHCYVGSSITCGVPGNIRKGLDAEGENTAFYNSLSPLKEVTTDNIAMLFPDTGYFAGINVNPIIIPKGTVDGSTTSSENIPWKGAISYSRFKAPIEPKFNPNIKPSKGPPEAGSLFGNMFVLNNPGNNAYNAPAGNFGGEVIVGNVVANFGSSSFDAPSIDFGGGAFGGAFNSPVDNNFKPQNNNFNNNSTQLPKDFGPQDFGRQDFGPQDFGSKDFGPQDFGSKDFGPQDFGSEDFGPQEFRTQKDFGPQENNPEGEFIPRDKSGKPMTLEELQELGIDKPKPSNPDGKEDFRDEASKEEFKENQDDILEEKQENSLETNEDSIDGFDQDDEEDESIEEENNTES